MVDKMAVPKKGDVVIRCRSGTSLCSATTIVTDGVVPPGGEAWGTLTGMRVHAKAVIAKTHGQIHEQTDEQ
jgi:hypothetical protein